VKSGGNDSDSSSFLLSITPSACYLDAFEWVLYTSFTYHICPRRELFANFKELDGGLMFMGDDHTCRLVDKSTVRIKMYDRIMRELKDMRYIPRITKNLIAIGDSKAEGLRGILGGGVLKMSSAH